MMYGLVWAIHNGQLRGFKAGARSIFDEEEPVGVPTDALVHDPDRQEVSPPTGPKARPWGGAGRSDQPVAEADEQRWRRR